MHEKLLKGGEMPPLVQGEVVRQTEHFRVVTDLSPEGEQKYFIEPKKGRGVFVISYAAIAWNNYSFTPRPMNGISNEFTKYVPCLTIDYTTQNTATLLCEVSNNQNTPSINTMEEWARQNIGLRDITYPDGTSIPNIRTCYLRVMQKATSDEIPPEIIHSSSPSPYFKVRHGWWSSVLGFLGTSLLQGNFADKEVNEKVKGFIEKFTGAEFRRRLKTAEDIAEANALIDAIWEKYGEK